MGSPIGGGGQNSKFSWWMRRRGTPAARSAPIAVPVMPERPAEVDVVPVQAGDQVVQPFGRERFQAELVPGAQSR